MRKKPAKFEAATTIGSWSKIGGKIRRRRRRRKEEEGEDTSSGPQNGHFQDIIKSDLIGIWTFGFLQRVLQTVIFAHTKFENAAMKGSIF